MQRWIASKEVYLSPLALSLNLDTREGRETGVKPSRPGRRQSRRLLSHEYWTACINLDVLGVSKAAKFPLYVLRMHQVRQVPPGVEVRFAKQSCSPKARCLLTGKCSPRTPPSGLGCWPFALLCFALLSLHISLVFIQQQTSYRGMHTVPHTLPCLMGGGSYDAVDTIDT